MFWRTCGNLRIPSARQLQMLFSFSCFFSPSLPFEPSKPPPFIPALLHPASEVNPNEWQHRIIHALCSLKACVKCTSVSVTGKVLFSISKWNICCCLYINFTPKPGFSFYLSGAHQIDKQENTWESGSKSTFLPRNNRCPFAGFQEAGSEIFLVILSNWGL